MSENLALEGESPSPNAGPPPIPPREPIVPNSGDADRTQHETSTRDKADDEPRGAAATSPSRTHVDQGDKRSGPEEDEGYLNALRLFLQQRLGISLGSAEEEKPPIVLEGFKKFTLEEVAKFIQSDKCTSEMRSQAKTKNDRLLEYNIVSHNGKESKKAVLYTRLSENRHGKNVIVMTGAGISTSAGIPDFRSPGTGLYDNLQKYMLPSPQSIFEIGYFRSNPTPFFKLAKELYPGNFKPTLCHYFIRLLAEKGLLSRTYTQNIDGLEKVAGLSGDLVVESHGTFHSAHCIDCQKEYSENWVKGKVFNDKVPMCKESECGGIVKPDITFFGEGLPKRFFQLFHTDFNNCDLLIVMGTSLKVQPFAGLIDRVGKTVPRLLINREKCGVALVPVLGGFDFDSSQRYRDVFYEGTCDDGCKKIASLLGWKVELIQMMKEGHKRIDREQSTAQEEAESSSEIVQPEEKVTGSPSSSKSKEDFATGTPETDSHQKPLLSEGNESPKKRNDTPSAL